MKHRTKTTQNKIVSSDGKMLPVVLGLIAILIFLIYIIGVTQFDPGTLQSRAGYPSSLSGDDDALSLQEDLRILGNDPVSAEELNFIKLE